MVFMNKDRYVIYNRNTNMFSGRIAPCYCKSDIWDAMFYESKKEAERMMKIGKMGIECHVLTVYVSFSS